ncbi:MAG: response regulator transcription factor [Flavobacteriales bacterium]|nr:response regulator transcription factor [Flavobacteriales bacterium]
MKVLIVEDELHSFDVLKYMIPLVTQDIKLVGHAKGVKEGIAKIKANQPDLIFMDIILNDGNGFDILKAFPKPTFKTIFVSSYENYALKAIKHSPVDYLLKPVSPSDLKKALDKAMEWYIEQNRRKHFLDTQGEQLSSNFYTQSIKEEEALLISDGHNYRFSAYVDIMFIQADEHYSNIHYNDNTSLLSSDSLSKLELDMPNYFFRIHRSLIVNLKRVVSFKSNTRTIVLSNGKELALAHRRKKEFIGKWKQLVC